MKELLIECKTPLGGLSFNQQNMGHNIMAIGVTGQYGIVRFCQFVVFYYFDENIGWSRKVYDFEGDINKALDVYNKLGSKWKVEDKDAIIKTFIDIRDNPGEIGKLTIRL